MTYTYLWLWQPWLGKRKVPTLILYFLFPRERRQDDQLPIPGSLAI